MDRYKECERMLKVAVGQQCKDNGNLIKQDFGLISRTVTGQPRTTEDVGEFIRRCFSYQGAADVKNLKRSCGILMDTVEYLTQREDSKAERDKRELVDKDNYLSNLKKLMKGRRIEEGDTIVNICHISDNISSGEAQSNGKSNIFQDFEDGFYGLEIVRSHETAEELRSAAADDDTRGAIEDYTNGSKSRYVGQGITILSEDADHRNTEDSSADTSDDEPIPKNLNMRKIFGMFGQSQLQVIESPFDAYYESDEKVGHTSKEDVPTHHIGSLHPPLHTYYTKGDKRKETIFNIASKNCLRKLYRKKEPKFVEKLRKHQEMDVEGSSHFALLAKGTRGQNRSKDMLLMNETALRSNTSPDKSPVEYIAFIGERSIRTFKCHSFGAYIYPNMESQQTEMCSSVFSSEVEQEKLRSRMLLKLLRYEFAWRNAPSQWRANNDAITKAISNIEWGCMWQDWNFFIGGLVTELDVQNILQRLKMFKSQEMNEAATALREMCDEFQDRLNVLQSTEPNDSSEISTALTGLLNEYRNKVLDAFGKCYSGIRSNIYTDLKPLHSKGFPPLLPATTVSGDSESEVQQGSTIAQSVEYVSEEEVLQMRQELLPIHNKDALDMASLTSLEDIMEPRLMGHSSFLGEPFLDLLQNPQNFEIKARKFNITGTAMDLYKKCSEAFRCKNIGVDKATIAKGLTVLNALVILLKHSERVFTNSKALQDSFGASFRIPAELATWIVSLFYDRNGAGDLFLNAKGYQKLICYIMWLCFYLPGGNDSYNFATLRNVDLKAQRKVHAIFDKCVPIAGLRKNTTKSSVYTIGLPLGGIPKTTTSSFKGLVGAISTFGKRARR